MSLPLERAWAIPASTASVAHASFPKGNPYIQMGDHLGQLYKDPEFATLFCEDCGQRALSGGQLALVSVMQFAEGLSDRQAADAVRGRIEWKYALGLELRDPGFDASVLSEFRSRLIQGGRSEQLLNTLLEQFQEKGWVKAKGKVRTDSTHVLAAIRQLNSLECVGETLRQALESLAVVAPDWLLEQVGPDWFERYGSRIEAYRIPKQKPQQEALALTIGRDGHHLLAAIDAAAAPLSWLAQVQAVTTLRQVWLQQYFVESGEVKRRPRAEQPPNHLLIQSPYDVEARNRTKRQTNWTGYSVHLTETIDAGLPHLITHVHTTPATSGDGAAVPVIHQALKTKGLLPVEHVVDTAYAAAKQVCDAQAQGIELVGPVAPDTSWQAREPDGLALPCFKIDWAAEQVTCPADKLSTSWKAHTEADGGQVIKAAFDSQDCQSCEQRPNCTRTKRGPRQLKFQPQAQHEALVKARAKQQTPEFKERYRQRAGIEGTISLACGHFGMRRSRYIGLAKTHLQNVLAVTAINLSRVLNWLADKPKSQTRTSRFAALAPLE